MQYEPRKLVDRGTEFISLPCRSRANGMNSVLRSGMTLIELLVVVSIIVLLAAATIPRLQPAMDRSRIREAARSVQLYLSSARNQAIATGRPCGVIIEPLPGEGGCSMTLSQVEKVPTGGVTLSLKTFRQVKSVASALQLPSPAVIDLTLSGFDTVQPKDTATFFGSGPQTIMFGPDGTIYFDPNGTNPITPICLLIGKRENVKDPDPKKSNLKDYSSLWVAINPRTGLIVTTDLATVDLAVVAEKTEIYQSRAYARKSDAMGGK